MCTDTELTRAVNIDRTVGNLEDLYEELKLGSESVNVVIVLHRDGKAKCFARAIESGPPSVEFPQNVRFALAGGPPQPCAFANSGGGHRLGIFC